MKLGEVPIVSIDRLYGGKSTFVLGPWASRIPALVPLGAAAVDALAARSPRAGRDGPDSVGDGDGRKGEDVSGRSYLVTGGTGFLGSALDAAAGRGRRAACACSTTTRAAAPPGWQDLDGGSSTSKATSATRPAVDRACEGIDCVCHLAFINGTEFFYSKPDLVLDVAVKGMINVLDGAHASAACPS